MDFDSMKDKAAELLGEHGDKVEDAAEKVGEMAKDRYGHDEQVDMAVDKIKDAVPGFDSSDSPAEQPPESSGQAG
jgi:hypothetical protein